MSYDVWELARIVKQEIQDQIGALRIVEFGEVDTVQLLPNGGYTAEVLLPGAGTTTPPLNCIANYVPTVGDWAVLLHPPGSDPMLIGAAPVRTNTIVSPDNQYAPLVHNHNDLYYTQEESDAQYAPMVHDHDDLYYTESEVNTFLTAKADVAQPAVTVPTPLSGTWAAAGSPHTAPNYYKSTTGRVYLSGVLTGGTIGTTAFTLPVGYRPAFRILRPVYSSNGSAQVLAAVQINTDGSVTPISGNAALVSLEGVSFRP